MVQHVESQAAFEPKHIRAAEPGKMVNSCLFSPALHNTESNDLLRFCRDSVSVKCCYLKTAKHNLLQVPMCFRSLLNNRSNKTDRVSHMEAELQAQLNPTRI